MLVSRAMPAGLSSYLLDRSRAPVIISGSLYMLAEFYGLYPHLLEQPASARGAKEDA